MKRISKFYLSEKREIEKWLVSLIFGVFHSFDFEFRKDLKNTDSKEEYDKNVQLNLFHS